MASDGSGGYREEQSLSRHQKSVLGGPGGIHWLFHVPFFFDDDDDSLFCELGGVFSPLLFPPFWFHHEATSLIGARLFVLSDTLPGLS